MCHRHRESACLSYQPRVAAYTSNEYTDSYLIDDADTSIAYVMAWGKNISNPAAKLFMEAVKKYAKGDDNIYGL